MSDGVTDNYRAQERFFERLRARLIDEDALYGEYNPELCPNLVRQDDDWCVPNGRFCGPCHAMWCEGCHAHFGPWGAWRAFADHHMAMVFLTYWCARVNGWAWDEMQLYRILRDAVPQLAEPVGWSP